jgi:hypothetical protein
MYVCVCVYIYIYIYKAVRISLFISNQCVSSSQHQSPCNTRHIFHMLFSYPKAMESILAGSAIGCEEGELSLL